MGNPISAVSLTMAVIDVMIKYGERTAELITDAKAFETVRTRSSCVVGISALTDQGFIGNA